MNCNMVLTLRQHGTAGRAKGDTLMPESQAKEEKEKARWPLDVIWLISVRFDGFGR